jgi:uncharacterized protein YndB with AHSA1/START domain
MTLRSETDFIERHIINAPRERVWVALSNAEQFGTWFGADLRGQSFVPGQRTQGNQTGCGHEGSMFDIAVELVEPQDVLAYRWRPYAADTTADFSAEQPTLVTFTLSDAPNGATVVTVVESGFDQLLPQRRLEAYPAHGKGWDAQLKNLLNHVSA